MIAYSAEFVNPLCPLRLLFEILTAPYPLDLNLSACYDAHFTKHTHEAGHVVFKSLDPQRILKDSTPKRLMIASRVFKSLDPQRILKVRG